MAQYFLGVDNGGTVTKAALFDQNGREVASAHRRAILSGICFSFGRLRLIL